MANTPHQRIRLRAVLTVAFAVAMMLTVHAGATADDGVRTYTVDCDLRLGNSPVNPHVGFRNCTLVWGMNIIDGSRWQTITFDMIDNMTDGYCARTHAWQWAATSVDREDWYAKECNGVWRTKTHTWGDETGGIGISIGWGPGDKWSTWVGSDHDEWPAPPGF